MEISFEGTSPVSIEQSADLKYEDWSAIKEYSSQLDSASLETKGSRAKADGRPLRF
jgi:phage FluMu protein gp41